MAKTCKFYKQQRQVSYDGGTTWQNLSEYRMGELYERNSVDCGGGGALYRVVRLESCLNSDKFSYMQEQVSYDGGSTWQNTGATSSYTCVETDSAECGWTMPDMTNLKKYEVYSKYDNYGGSCIPNARSVVVPTGFYTVTTACDGTTAQTGTESSATNGLHTLIYGDCFSGGIGLQELAFKTGHNACTMAYGDMGNPYPNVIFSSGVTSIGQSGLARSHFNKLKWSTEPNSITIGHGAFSGTVIDNFSIPKNITSVDDYGFVDSKIGSAMTFNHKVALGTTIWGGSSIKTLTFNAGASLIMSNVSEPFRYTSVEKVTLNGLKADYDYDFDDFHGILIDNRIEGGLKYRGEYSNGDTNVIACDGNTSLTSGETKDSYYDSSLLTDITIGSCVSFIDRGAFNGCSALTGLSISNSVTTIGAYAFNACTGLSGTLVIPNGVTSISGESAFFGCSNITGLSLSNNLQTIGNGAFTICTSLTSLNIPSSVTSIGGNAFAGCTALTGITMNSVTPPTLGSGAFDNTNDCPIYVPIAGARAYLSNVDWMPYSYRIEPVGQN